MKKTKLTVAALLTVLSLMLTSCSLLDVSSMVSSGNDTAGDEKDYLTREEVEQMISGIEENVTVNSGDSYDITINSQYDKNLLAASRGLLSAVSINCVFDVTVSYSSGFGRPAQTYTTQKTSAGSGVIYQLDKDLGSAYIITNYHVVYCNGADTADDISDDIKVYLYGKEYVDYAIPATYVGGSMNYDIAVLKVTNNDVLRESNAIAATFADSNKISVLDTAIAIGNPEGRGISATIGAVNIESEELEMTSIDGKGVMSLRVMRTDAAVNGGNSGGGLFNDSGEVIGIVNAKLADSDIDNIGYAIPSNVARYVADNIVYYDNQDASNDSVYRLIIGVNVTISDSFAELDSETGRVNITETVIVGSVVEGGIADGVLRADDVIKALTIDGVRYEILRTYNVIDVMLGARIGSNVVFTIERDGQVLDVTMDTANAQLTKY